MLNRCEFIGNLGADPEIRTMQSGDKIANLRIAVSEKWRDKQSGEQREKTEWVPIVIFGPLAKTAEQYLRKGSKVFVAGKFTTRKWQDQSGNDRYSTEIVLQGFDAKLVMLDGAQGGGSRDSGNGSYQEPLGQSGAPAGGAPSGGAPDPYDGDSIPFSAEWRV
ncbi:single-stranded DNA-binding protein [Paracoccus onubensis]|uniref:single-stranded DNA-binding protein n=1 Tax=Paracoccus onubensis TaxID=1675788 RepID=UPI0027303B21|nr:single-stranded DNA-binding protein [Paracoccus onubensis]MDP0925688.1 single-stranded DNA-binding protein [Paracoccus onubensis]